MKRLLSVLLILFSIASFGQGNFRFAKKTSKTVIHFELVNNLVIVPVYLNGVKLNFLLDSGVEETILFSLEETKEIQFENIEKIKLRGLGNQESVEGLKSTGNKLQFEDMYDDNHLIYIVLDQEFNFSSHIGIPVNGIIGYHFFQNNLVEIDYDRKRIVVYHDSEKMRAKFARKMDVAPISIELRKPYLETKVQQQGDAITAKLLIDTGSSDAVWLFDNVSAKIKPPEKYFDDFLGRGFSGEIMGKRAKIERFELSRFLFDEPIAAFPDSVSLRHVSMVKDRLGSLGGEILKRFTVVFDYPKSQLFLKRGKRYSEAFHYNMSGLEIEHSGLQWIRETVELNTNLKGEQYTSNMDRARGDFQYKFELKPIYSITNVREGSPAAEAGVLKGDMIVAINGRLAYRLSLQQITELLRSEPDREIVLQLDRGGVTVNASFRLKELL